MPSSVPDRFAASTARRDGAAGARWLASLPETLDALLARWSCTRDGPSRHGEVGLVVPVRSPHGQAVVKISPPHPGNVHEAAALRVFAGRGAVRLLGDDPERVAMLLERADGRAPGDVLRPDASIEMLGALAARLAVPAPADVPTLASTAQAWSDELVSRAAAAPGLVPPSALSRALEAVDSLAADRTATMLHGDLHEGNVLGAEREPWLAIDPKGMAGPAAFDAWTAVLARYDETLDAGGPDVAVLRRRVVRFARAAGVDAARAVELTHARMVTALLHETTTGGPPALRDVLAALVAQPL